MSSQQAILEHSYRESEWVETRPHCARNQARNSMLGTQVVVGDFPLPTLQGWMAKLVPDSGAGLWISPVRGFPSTRGMKPIDLIYLDVDCRVLELVESFPLLQVSPSSRPAASVLAVPAGTISSSNTRRGDCLLICLPSELKDNHPAAGDCKSDPADPQAADDIAPQRLRVPDQTNTQTDCPAPAGSPSHQPVSNTEPHHPTHRFNSWKNRITSLFAPRTTDQRNSPRKPVADLVASFWTGGPPATHAIRDVSPSGLYVITTERWYIGTIVRMQLTRVRTDRNESENTICVCAEAVRWGNDGVGLRFLSGNDRKTPSSHVEKIDGADREQLNRFLKNVLS